MMPYFACEQVFISGRSSKRLFVFKSSICQLWGMCYNFYLFSPLKDIRNLSSPGRRRLQGLPKGESKYLHKLPILLYKRAAFVALEVVNDSWDSNQRRLGELGFQTWRDVPSSSFSWASHIVSPTIDLASTFSIVVNCCDQLVPLGLPFQLPTSPGVTLPWHQKDILYLPRGGLKGMVLL